MYDLSVRIDVLYIIFRHLNSKLPVYCKILQLVVSIF